MHMSVKFIPTNSKTLILNALKYILIIKYNKIHGSESVFSSTVCLIKGLHTWITCIPPANVAAAKVKGHEGHLSPLGHRLHTQNKV